MSLIVTPIPAFNDNYIWLVQGSTSPCVAIVDPGDAAPVLKYLEEHQLSLSAIILTHHHADHIGGVSTLAERYPAAHIWGPHSDKIPQVHTLVAHGDSFEICGYTFSVLEVPGHTLDHIAYYASPLSDGEYGSVFCGDTLFAAGCGRMFEGTAPMMSASLNKLKNLPATTRVYCAHEYTQANIRFARAVEPANEALRLREQEAQETRDQGLPTLPSTIELEHRTNPFLRCHIDDVQQAAQAQSQTALATEAEVFGALRAWKDNF